MCMQNILNMMILVCEHTIPNLVLMSTVTVHIFASYVCTYVILDSPYNGSISKGIIWIFCLLVLYTILDKDSQ